MTTRELQKRLGVASDGVFGPRRSLNPDLDGDPDLRDADCAALARQVRKVKPQHNSTQSNRRETRAGRMTYVQMA